MRTAAKISHGRRRSRSSGVVRETERTPGTVVREFSCVLLKVDESVVRQLSCRRASHAEQRALRRWRGYRHR